MRFSFVRSQSQLALPGVSAILRGSVTLKTLFYLLSSLDLRQGGRGFSAVYGAEQRNISRFPCPAAGQICQRRRRSPPQASRRN